MLSIIILIESNRRTMDYQWFVTSPPARLSVSISSLSLLWSSERRAASVRLGSTNRPGEQRQLNLPHPIGLNPRIATRARTRDWAECLQSYLLKTTFAKGSVKILAVAFNFL